MLVGNCCCCFLCYNQLFSITLVLVSFEVTTAAVSPTDGEALLIYFDIFIIQDV